MGPLCGLSVVAHHMWARPIRQDKIARLANLWFTEGIFPNGYKLTIVTAILKKPNPHHDDFSNYRPISNINNISKLLEHMFSSCFQSYMCTSDNVSSVQSAYVCHYCYIQWISSLGHLMKASHHIIRHECCFWRHSSQYTSKQTLDGVQPSNFSMYQTNGIHFYWFWSVCLQLQLSHNMEFHSYLH